MFQDKKKKVSFLVKHNLMIVERKQKPEKMRTKYF